MDVKIFLNDNKNYTDRCVSNPFSYHVLKTIQFQGGIDLDRIFDLCDIIEKLQKELIELKRKTAVTYVLHQNKTDRIINTGE